MSFTRPLILTLALLLGLLGACGSDSDEAATAADPAASATPEGADPAATADDAEDTEGTPGAANGTAANGNAAAPGGLPVPVAPASWRATMNELTVDGVTVRFVSASCGAIAMMPVIQALSASTASCTQRADTQVSAVFESGRVTAIDTNGPDASCVREGVMQASTNVTCQFQLTFGN